jgi:hypothetical protein
MSFDFPLENLNSHSNLATLTLVFPVLGIAC